VAGVLLGELGPAGRHASLRDRDAVAREQVDQRVEVGRNERQHDPLGLGVDRKVPAHQHSTEHIIVAGIGDVLEEAVLAGDHPAVANAKEHRDGVVARDQEQSRAVDFIGCVEVGVGAQAQPPVREVEDEREAPQSAAADICRDARRGERPARLRAEIGDDVAQRERPERQTGQPSEPADDAGDTIGEHAGGVIDEHEDELIGHQDRRRGLLAEAGPRRELRQVDDVDDPGRREEELDDAEVEADSRRHALL